MNSPVPPPLKPRRRYGRWVFLGLLVMVTPIVIVAVGVASMLTLNRDAALLRREVMAATDADWSTKVQMSVGRLTLGAVRTGLSFVQADHMDEARLALGAVRHASVGVYECNDRTSDFSRKQLFARTDGKMKARGWTRLVGVSERNEAVLIYTSDNTGSDSRMDLCLAVIDGNTMVVVSTKVDADSLAELVEKHAPRGELKRKLKLADL
jgi:hypothetical protein